MISNFPIFQPYVRLAATKTMACVMHQTNVDVKEGGRGHSVNNVKNTQIVSTVFALNPGSVSARSPGEGRFVIKVILLLMLDFILS